MSQAALGHQPQRADYHQTLVSLLDGAEAGCYVCEFVRQRLLAFSKRDNCRVKDFIFNLNKLKTATHILLTMELFYGREEATEWMYFWVAPTRGFATSEGENIRRRNGCIPEAEAVMKIKTWMGLCLRDHEGARCGKNVTQPSSYPSRLLELGPSSFRVLRTAVHKPRGPYATLSYCWGPNPAFLRLTASNEKELEAGVSSSQLPLAFREAISIIQALSFRYLWIDSLCIIQSGPGSAEDWETELARMYQIYADSILTLALTCVASPFESILNQARTRKTAAPPFEIKAENGHRDSVADPFAIVFQDYFAHTLYDQPLNFRAWALQERLMSTRLVSFGLDELFWDCAQLPNASESIPDGLQATQIETEYLIAFRLANKTVPDRSNRYALFETWWRLLHEYTKRGLTYPKTDKLMAMSSIAHDMGKAMDDVYIAGHFWKTLPASLNWVLKPSSRTRSNRRWGKLILSQIPDVQDSRLDRYEGRARRIFWSEKPHAQDNGPRTPSWSWASLNGPVYRWGTGLYDRQVANAVSYTLELVNKANPTGPCISASICIVAYCTELEWQSQNEPVLVARENIWIDLNLDEPEVRRAKGTKSLMVAITEDRVNKVWSGLVVERIPHEGRIGYRRIGHFAIMDDENGGSAWWDDRISVFGGKKRVELV